MTSRGSTRLEKFALTALLLAIGGLAMLNWRLLSWVPETQSVPVSIATPRPPSAPAQSAPRPDMPALQPAYRDILARPLFDPTRRPPRPAPPGAIAHELVPAATPFPASKYRLVGIMHQAGSPARALLRDNPSDPGVWVDEGGTWQGWAVARIADDQVEFKGNGATGVLKLLVVVDVSAIANPKPPPQPAAAHQTPPQTAGVPKPPAK